jgi:hypothetical protein
LSSAEYELMIVERHFILSEIICFIVIIKAKL